MSAPPLEAGGGFPGFVDLGSPLPPFFFSFFLLFFLPPPPALGPDAFAFAPPLSANSTPSTGVLSLFRPACTVSTPSNASTTVPTTPLLRMRTVSPMTGASSPNESKL